MKLSGEGAKGILDLGLPTINFFPEFGTLSG